MEVYCRAPIRSSNSQSPERMRSVPKRVLYDQQSSQSFGQVENSQSDSESFNHDESQFSDSSEYICSRLPESPKNSTTKRSLHSGSVPRKSFEKQSYIKNNTFQYDRESYSSEGGSNYWMLSSIAIILMIIVAVWLRPYSSNTESESGRLKCSFQQFKRLYPEQDLKVWRFLTVGIENILNKDVEKPGVYLFAHEGSQRAKQLVRDIAYNSSACFGNNEHFEEMEKGDFITGNREYGYAIEIFKKKIKNGNVILIVDLNEIPADAARALHSICDTESPIAPNVVIFLTITVNSINPGNIESIVEDELHNMWEQTLASNELGPLIARVTDQVLALKS